MRFFAHNKFKHSTSLTQREKSKHLPRASWKFRKILQNYAEFHRISRNFTEFLDFLDFLEFRAGSAKRIKPAAKSMEQKSPDEIIPNAFLMIAQQLQQQKNNRVEINSAEFCRTLRFQGTKKKEIPILNLIINLTLCRFSCNFSLLFSHFNV